MKIAWACKRGEVSLDGCTCPIHLARSSRGRYFFRHNPSHTGRHAREDWRPESEEHEALIIGRHGQRLAVEIQLSVQTAADTVERTRSRVSGIGSQEG